MIDVVLSLGSPPSPWCRLAARLIDWAIHTLIVAAVWTVLITTEVTNLMSENALLLVALGGTALLRGVFEVVFVAVKMGTPGKLAMGLRVCSTARLQGPPSRGQAVGRGLLIDAPTVFGGVYYTVLILAPPMSWTLVMLGSLLWGAVWVLWLVLVLSIFSNPSRLGLHDRFSGTVVADGLV